jgi:hypothetical protein
MHQMLNKLRINTSEACCSAQSPFKADVCTFKTSNACDFRIIQASAGYFEKMHD